MAIGFDKNYHGAADGRYLSIERVWLLGLICLYIVLSCVSLACVAHIYPEFRIFFFSSRLATAVAVIAAFFPVALLFVIAEFSFGYFVGFYLFTMVLGYLWLNVFSESIYNHKLSGLSAAMSAVAFLIPALFIRSPLPRIWTLSPKAFDRLLDGMLLIGTVTAAIGATYNFRLVSIGQIYDYREALYSPTALNYLTGVTTGALLPFAFACFVERKNSWRAAAALFLLLLFYPITLSKIALLSSAWLIVMTLLSRIFDLRASVVISLLAPLALGLLLFLLFELGVPYGATIPYFGLVNFRMIAIPSLAMDYYNDFFFRNDLTYFCQIRLLKPFVACPYEDQIAVVIYKAFGIGGNFNASLFATEGIASVGTMFAPVAVLVGGLIVALGNRASASLPPRLVLASSAVLVQLLVNVPFTTVLLTHGAVILFLLWYVMPRTFLAST
ncbi:MAG: hypothetical protein ACREEK_05730 [Bradyrhizobium sp.]